MLSKCANPSCFASYRYFHEGKLFRIEMLAEKCASVDVPRAKAAARVEFFWLCDRCAPKMSLECGAGGQVVVKPVVHDLQEVS